MPKKKPQCLPRSPLKCNLKDFKTFLLPRFSEKLTSVKYGSEPAGGNRSRKDTRDCKELSEHVKGGAPSHLPRSHIGHDELQLVKQVPELKAKDRDASVMTTTAAAVSQLVEEPVLKLQNDTVAIVSPLPVTVWETGYFEK